MLAVSLTFSINCSSEVCFYQFHLIGYFFPLSFSSFSPSSFPFSSPSLSPSLSPSFFLFLPSLSPSFPFSSPSLSPSSFPSFSPSSFPFLVLLLSFVLLLIIHSLYLFRL